MLLLNRPDNRNALSRSLCNELAKHVEEIKTQKNEQGIRALVIASNIDKAFCAGADLKERKDMSVDEYETGACDYVNDAYGTTGPKFSLQECANPSLT